MGRDNGDGGAEGQPAVAPFPKAFEARKTRLGSTVSK
jgi:hypothetical protein